jgi:hypothetical protein
MNDNVGSGVFIRRTNGDIFIGPHGVVAFLSMEVAKRVIGELPSGMFLSTDPPDLVTLKKAGVGHVNMVMGAYEQNGEVRLEMREYRVEDLLAHSLAKSDGQHRHHSLK